MKKYLVILTLAFFISACQNEKSLFFELPENWKATGPVGQEALDNIIKEQGPEATKLMSDLHAKLNVQTYRLDSPNGDVRVWITKSLKTIEINSSDSEKHCHLIPKQRIDELNLKDKVKAEEFQTSSLKGYYFTYENPRWQKYPNARSVIYRFCTEFRLFGKHTFLNIKIESNELKTKQTSEALNIIKSIKGL